MARPREADSGAGVRGGGETPSLGRGDGNSDKAKAACGVGGAVLMASARLYSK